MCQQPRLRLPLTSIVKVFTSRSSPNFHQPWQNKMQTEVTGSAFAIEDLDGQRRLLTNAHVVADYTRVMVRRHAAADKFAATPVSIGHECDLALLDVPEDAFWEGIQPLAFGPVPELRDRVTAIGFPTGGDNISVTSGVVSRVDCVQYAHAASHLLAVQIDASINPGNSGGPALAADGRVAGVAFQNVPDAQAMGFLVPRPVIDHFLLDWQRDRGYVGFCKLGVRCQTLENPALRARLGMSAGQSGLMVNSVQPVSPAAGQLEKRDVLLEVDGVAVANDGTIEWRLGERVPFDHLISCKMKGDETVLRVLRDGAERLARVRVAPLEQLVPVHAYEQLPEYVMYAGLVFSPLVQPLLYDYGNDWYNAAPKRLVDKALNAMLDVAGRQVVVLVSVLQDKANAGYEMFTGLQVEAVNGTKLHNLAHLAELVTHAHGDFISFELEDDRLLVLDTETAAQATARIQKRHRIAHATWFNEPDGAHATASGDAPGAAPIFPVADADGRSEHRGSALRATGASSRARHGHGTPREHTPARAAQAGAPGGEEARLLCAGPHAASPCSTQSGAMARAQQRRRRTTRSHGVARRAGAARRCPRG